MSIITVDVGQCGNQLGFGILDSLFSHLTTDSEIEAFFRMSESGTRPHARAVCLDTEPKVIHACLQQAFDKKNWIFDPSSVLYRHGGAGNNWAMGYEMGSGEFSIAALDCIRRELEHCDDPASLLMIHSVGGGTGSGLGTRMTEAAADEFPNSVITNLAITPYHFGEVVVQHYNTVLCLSKISENSNAVLLFENEVAHNICTSLRSAARPTLADINCAIVRNVIPALLPKRTAPHGCPAPLVLDIAHLCAHPGYRFLDIKNTPQTSDESVSFQFDLWDALVHSLQRMQRLGAVSELAAGAGFRSRSYRPDSAHTAKARSSSVPRGGGRLTEQQRARDDNSSDVNRAAAVQNIASVLVLRGQEAQSAAAVHSQVEGVRGNGGATTATPNSTSPFSYKHGAMSNTPEVLSSEWRRQHVSWQQSSHPQTIAYSDTLCNGYQRSACLLTNGQAILPVMERALDRASRMFVADAYLHQYSSYGVEKQDFLEAFHSVGQVVKNYQSL
eukprot:gene3548-7060_t